jgi:hypothetical protein
MRFGILLVCHKRPAPPSPKCSKIKVAHYQLYLMFVVWFACMLTANPKQILAQIRKRLSPPVGVPLKGWSGTIKGIHSDHWGGRETPRTESPEA